MMQNEKTTSRRALKILILQGGLLVHGDLVPSSSALASCAPEMCVTASSQNLRSNGDRLGGMY